MMIDYVDTVTTIELDETVVTVETRFVELITIEVLGLLGAKGDNGEKGDKGDGVGFFTAEMNGLSSTYTANHNLGRFIAVARVYQPDGEVAQVEVQNKDNEGNVSQNVAQVISSVPMLGTLTLI